MTTATGHEKASNPILGSLSNTKQDDFQNSSQGFFPQQQGDHNNVTFRHLVELPIYLNNRIY